MLPASYGPSAGRRRSPVSSGPSASNTARPNRGTSQAADAEVVGPPGRQLLPLRGRAPVDAPLLTGVPPELRPPGRGVLKGLLTAVHGHVEQAVHRSHCLRSPAGGPVGLEDPIAIAQAQTIMPYQRPASSTSMESCAEYQGIL